MRALLPRLMLLMLLGVIWGLSPSVAKLAMAGGMRPLGVATLSAALSAVVLLALAAARGQAPRWDRPHLLQYAAGGFVGLALAHLFGFTGLTRAPAGLFSLLIPLSALLTVLFFALAGIERATPRVVGGALVGMLGVALAMAPGAALPDPALLPWALLMLGTPVCFALANLLSVRLAVRGTPPLAQAAGTVALAAASAALVALPIGHLGWPATPGIAALVVLHGLLTAAGYLLYFRLLVAAGGVFTSQSSYVVTLAGLGWGALLFGEQPGWLTLPAAALVFAGLALVTLRPQPAR